MHEELGTVEEPVALSPQEALNSAERLLAQQGYENVQRTATLVTAQRHERSGFFKQSTFYLTVAVRPLPEGGVEINLRGNDRKGIEARQTEWVNWAEGLPKVELQEQADERVEKSTRSAESAGTRVGEARAETPENSGAEREVPREALGDAPETGEKPMRESPAKEPNGDGEDVKAPSGGSSSWASAAPWKRKSRVAPGKRGEEPSTSSEQPSYKEPESSTPKQEVSNTQGSEENATRVVEAESFRLVNKEGKLRAALTLVEEEPYLTLTDENEDPRLVLSVNSDGVPSISLADHDGRPRLNLSLRHDSSPTLDLADNNGQVRLRMTLEAGQFPALTFVDEDEKPRAVLKEDSSGRYLLALLDESEEIRATFFLDDDGSTNIVFRDEEGEGRFMLRADAEGTSSLGMLDRDNNMRIGLQVSDDGNPGIALTDDNGNLQAMLRVGDLSGPSLTLLDESGNVIWAAP